jgi:hypothetical protein
MPTITIEISDAAAEALTAKVRDENAQRARTNIQRRAQAEIARLDQQPVPLDDLPMLTIEDALQRLVTEATRIYQQQLGDQLARDIAAAKPERQAEIRQKIAELRDFVNGAQ